MRQRLTVLILIIGSLAAVQGSAQVRRGGRDNNDSWDYRNKPAWDSSWNRRPSPSSGACFFTNANFSGNRFCVKRGDRLEGLPANFGDNISSIQLFGGARATVFNDRGFRGGSQQFGSSVRDLSRVRFRDGHTWNNRISSMVIR